MSKLGSGGIMSAGLVALFGSFAAACGAPDEASTSSAEFALDSHTPIAIGPSSGAVRPLDFFKCADEFGTCIAAEGKYIAYGANGSFVYRLASTNTFECRNEVLAPTGDPATGFLKACYFANYQLFAGEGALFFGNSEIAYGKDGGFTFRSVIGRSICDRGLFGYPNDGLEHACFRALPDYKVVADENGVMRGLNKTPVAFGGSGRFAYKVLSGNVPCTVATFGTGTAFFGGTRRCYVAVRSNFIADEGQSFNLGTTTRVAYGSGLNGNYVLADVTAGVCGNELFQGDPDYGVVKHCWTPPPIPQFPATGLEPPF